jgi:hypothetical protein
VSSLIKIRPVGVELFHSDLQTGGWTDRYDESISRFSQFCEHALKTVAYHTIIDTEFVEENGEKAKNKKLLLLSVRLLATRMSYNFCCYAPSYKPSLSISEKRHRSDLPSDQYSCYAVTQRALTVDMNAEKYTRKY